MLRVLMLGSEGIGERCIVLYIRALSGIYMEKKPRGEEIKGLEVISEPYFVLGILSA